MNKVFIGGLLFLFIMSCTGKKAKDVKGDVSPTITEEILLDSVWAANGVGFAMQIVKDKLICSFF